MKILEGSNLGDRVLGKVKCEQCEALLEVHVKDCRSGTTTDFDGSTGDAYCCFNCPVCDKFQNAPPGSKHLVDAYKAKLHHEAAKPPPSDYK